jgi:hypothetical protein
MILGPAFSTSKAKALGFSVILESRKLVISRPSRLMS